jgi:hypothetical protein
MAQKDEKDNSWNKNSEKRKRESSDDDLDSHEIMVEDVSDSEAGTHSKPPLKQKYNKYIPNNDISSARYSDYTTEEDIPLSPTPQKEEYTLQNYSVNTDAIREALENPDIQALLARSQAEAPTEEEHEPSYANLTQEEADTLKILLDEVSKNPQQNIVAKAKQTRRRRYVDPDAPPRRSTRVMERQLPFQNFLDAVHHRNVISRKPIGMIPRKEINTSTPNMPEATMNIQVEQNVAGPSGLQRRSPASPEAAIAFATYLAQKYNQTPLYHFTPPMATNFDEITLPASLDHTNISYRSNIGTVKYDPKTDQYITEEYHKIIHARPTTPIMQGSPNQTATITELQKTPTKQPPPRPPQPRFDSSGSSADTSPQRVEPQSLRAHTPPIITEVTTPESITPSRDVNFQSPPQGPSPPTGVVNTLYELPPKVIVEQINISETINLTDSIDDSSNPMVTAREFPATPKTPLNPIDVTEHLQEDINNEISFEINAIPPSPSYDQRLSRLYDEQHSQIPITTHLQTIEVAKDGEQLNSDSSAEYEYQLRRQQASNRAAPCLKTLRFMVQPEQHPGPPESPTFPSKLSYTWNRRVGNKDTPIPKPAAQAENHTQTEFSDIADQQLQAEEDSSNDEELERYHRQRQDTKPNSPEIESQADVAPQTEQERLFEQRLVETAVRLKSIHDNIRNAKSQADKPRGNQGPPRTHDKSTQTEEYHDSLSSDDDRETARKVHYNDAPVTRQPRLQRKLSAAYRSFQKNRKTPYFTSSSTEVTFPRNITIQDINTDHVSDYQDPQNPASSQPSVMVLNPSIPRHITVPHYQSNAPTPNPVINALTHDNLDEFADVILAGQDADGHRVTTLKQRLAMLRQQLEVHTLALDVLEAQFGEMNVENIPPAILDTMCVHTTKKEKLTSHIEAHEAAINAAKETQNKFKTKLDVPPDTGIDQPIHITDLMTAVPKVDARDKNGFAAMFEKLTTYGQLKGYSHNNYKAVIKFLLTDYEMIQAFKSIRTKSLPDIIADFTTRYVTQQNIRDYSKRLNMFRREKDETLRATVSRFIQLLYQTEELYPIHQRQTRKEFALEQLLLNVTGPTTSAFLHTMKNRAQKFGTPIPHEQYLEAAEDQEYSNNDAPMQAVFYKHQPPPGLNNITTTNLDRTQQIMQQLSQEQIIEATNLSVPRLDYGRPQPYLTGGNATPIENPKYVPEPIDQSRPPRTCYGCGSADPQHDWGTCKQRQNLNQGNPTGGARPRRSCHKCGGTFPHTWNSCTNPRIAPAAPPTPRQPRACYACKGTHFHNWKECIKANPPSPTAPRVCNNCGSGHQHDWRTCNGPMQLPQSAPVEPRVCNNCGSGHQHDWRTCTGPNQTSQPEAPKVCFNCNSGHQHDWRNCHLTNPVEQQTAMNNATYAREMNQEQIRRNPRACPICQGTHNHIWNNCGQDPYMNQQQQRFQQPVQYIQVPMQQPVYYQPMMAQPQQVDRPPIRRNRNRPCPYCGSQAQHNWNDCEALAQSLNT